MLADVAGITARYEKAGSGPAVLALHGWGANLETISPIVQCLAQSHTIFTLDLPGFGQTAQPGAAWGVFDYADWVVNFLDVVGCSCVDLVGHSFGGSVAIVLAARYPHRVHRLVLVNSAGIRAPKTWLHHLRVRVFKTMRVLLQLIPIPSWRHKAKDVLYAVFGSTDYRAAGAMRASFVRVVNEDLRGLLPRIQAPSLVIWGENDQDVPASHGQIMAQEIPNAQLHVLAGAGHYSYLDRLPQFCRLVREFLTQDSSRAVQAEGADIAPDCRRHRQMEKSL